jgi:hypothetical protein
MTKESPNVILVCNPKAGGRWKQLAGILDSAEAQHVRRIVTDSIDDIGSSLVTLGRRVGLVVIYGGDGTIQKILSDTFLSGASGGPSSTPYAFVGGGTMNLTARWSGWKDSPDENFRSILRAFNADKLATREVPLLSIQQGGRVQYGFLFVAGPPVRVLHEYEQGSKGRLAAATMAVRTVAAIFGKNPIGPSASLKPMAAEILVDGKPLPYGSYVMTACGTTGAVQIGVQPFVGERTRESFFMLAYAADPREVAVLLPFLARGMLPIDPKSLLQPVSSFTAIGLSYFGKGSLPLDPRYINRPVGRYELRTSERFYTIDGEVFESTGEPIVISLGPTIRLAINA